LPSSFDARPKILAGCDHLYLWFHRLIVHDGMGGAHLDFDGIRSWAGLVGEPPHFVLELFYRLFGSYCEIQSDLKKK
jgi:hypothetical protein